MTLARDSLTDNADMCSDPDARAKFELSPTKHVIALENIGLNCASDGDVTVMGENVAGDTVAHEGEYIRVSMISVDENRTVTPVYRPILKMLLCYKFPSTTEHNIGLHPVINGTSRRGMWYWYGYWYWYCYWHWYWYWYWFWYWYHIWSLFVPIHMTN